MNNIIQKYEIGTQSRYKWPTNTVNSTHSGLMLRELSWAVWVHLVSLLPSPCFPVGAAKPGNGQSWRLTLETRYGSGAGHFNYFPSFPWETFWELPVYNPVTCLFAAVETPHSTELHPSLRPSAHLHQNPIFRQKRATNGLHRTRVSGGTPFWRDTMKVVAASISSNR